MRVEGLRQKASWRATAEEEPRWRAVRWLYETQSCEAWGGSNENDGNRVAGASPCGAVEVPGHPLDVPGYLGTTASEASTGR